MATRLKLVFTDAVGTTTHSYNYANPDATQAAVNGLVAATIANGAIFQRVPLAIKSATIVTTTEQDVTPQVNP